MTSSISSARLSGELAVVANGKSESCCLNSTQSCSALSAQTLSSIRSGFPDGAKKKSPEPKNYERNN
ncbi:MAG TPA: hypothetical protein QF762_03450 [Acidimicrobiales bacterium]|nr:hypothetical protein [Acidimicrobiales bacterium]